MDSLELPLRLLTLENVDVGILIDSVTHNTPLKKHDDYTLRLCSRTESPWNNLSLFVGFCLDFQTPEKNKLSSAGLKITRQTRHAG